MAHIIIHPKKFTFNPFRINQFPYKNHSVLYHQIIYQRRKFHN